VAGGDILALSSVLEGCIQSLPLATHGGFMNATLAGWRNFLLFLFVESFNLSTKVFYQILFLCLLRCIFPLYSTNICNISSLLNVMATLIPADCV
jgi:hypothetical protein